MLLFLIIKHQTEVANVPPPYDLNVEVEDLTAQLAAATSTVEELKQARLNQDQRINNAQSEVEKRRSRLAEARARGQKTGAMGSSEIAALRAAIKRLELEKRHVQAQIQEKSRSVRTFVGEGNREYLTGIQLGGQRILILLDVSASMLDQSIVNIIRRRNMDDSAKRRSQKWQQALATVDWISARFPKNSRYQIYAFNERATPILPNKRGQWLSVSDVNQLNTLIETTRLLVPEGGSNLERAFMVIESMSPRPDNVFLITDGLPTQGLKKSSSSNVSGRDRLRLFETAVTRIPRGVPVNVILLPMEGDPMAPSAFWQIALYTKGAFLSPASDWP